MHSSSGQGVDNMVLKNGFLLIALVAGCLGKCVDWFIHSTQKKQHFLFALNLLKIFYVSLFEELCFLQILHLLSALLNHAFDSHLRENVTFCLHFISIPSSSSFNTKGY